MAAENKAETWVSEETSSTVLATAETAALKAAETDSVDSEAGAGISAEDQVQVAGLKVSSEPTAEAETDSEADALNEDCSAQVGRERETETETETEADSGASHEGTEAD